MLHKAFAKESTQLCDVHDLSRRCGRIAEDNRYGRNNDIATGLDNEVYRKVEAACHCGRNDLLEVNLGQTSQSACGTAAQYLLSNSHEQGSQRTAATKQEKGGRLGGPVSAHVANTTMNHRRPLHRLHAGKVRAHTHQEHHFNRSHPRDSVFGEVDS
ncbi:hypothetical protein JAAARDRAFT_404502 [Jaapia argillacea MUCL 33604]|uniref:Uncharacterized protein n=1 Tax=Jaapia argillacea MUCL 33604 TaxID=933084 RepID=A0A067PHB0_9AGAM|nr:hypothetical protein JAAARDRAFT_404502 [Jaapia argillacea MUCL 33604]